MRYLTAHTTAVALLMLLTHFCGGAAAGHQRVPSSAESLNRHVADAFTQSSMEAMGAVHALLAKSTTSRHAFSTQQVNSATASEACRATLTGYQDKYGTCTSIGSGPSVGVTDSQGRYKTSADVVAAYDAWKSTCGYQAIAEFENVITTCKDSYTDYEDSLLGIRLILHFANSVGTDGQICAVSWNSVGHFTVCDRANPSDCTGKLAESCEAVNFVTTETVDAGINAGGTSEPRTQTCAFQFGSSSAVGRICNGCFSSFITRNRDISRNNTFLTQMGVFDRLICTKSIDGNLCLNEIAEEATKDRLTNDELGSICADTRGKLSCYLGLLSTSAAQGKASVLQSFRQCVAQYPNNALSQRLFCLPSFKEGILGFKAARAITRNLCTKNAAGSYCFLAGESLYYDTQGCYNLARTNRSCTNCSTILQTAVDNMGCCAGLTQEVETLEQQLTPTDLPQIPGLASASELNIADPTQSCTVPDTIPTGQVATTLSGSGSLQDMANCGVTGLQTTLCTKCAESSKRVKKELRVRIQWNKIQADEALLTKIKLGLRADMADNLGLEEDDIVNDALVEDTSFTVTTTTTTSRRQTTSTGSGVKYEFEISGATDEQVDAVAENFDSLQTEGTLTSENTEAATSDCGCASSDGQLTVQETNSGAAEKNSSAIAIAVSMVVAFVTVIAAM